MSISISQLHFQIYIQQCKKLHRKYRIFFPSLHYILVRFLRQNNFKEINHTTINATTTIGNLNTRYQYNDLLGLTAIMETPVFLRLTISSPRSAVEKLPTGD